MFLESIEFIETRVEKVAPKAQQILAFADARLTSLVLVIYGQ